MTADAAQATPHSLLEKLQRPEQPSFQDAWRRFVHLYTPLLYLWTRRLGIPAGDAEDLVQDAFTVLAQKMPAFRYDPTQRFRGWLWTLLRNRWRDRVRHFRAGPHQAGGSALEGLATDDNVEEFAEEEYRTYLVGRALQVCHPR